MGREARRYACPFSPAHGAQDKVMPDGDASFKVRAWTRATKSWLPTPQSQPTALQLFKSSAALIRVELRWHSHWHPFPGLITHCRASPRGSTSEILEVDEKRSIQRGDSCCLLALMGLFSDIQDGDRSYKAALLCSALCDCVMRGLGEV